MSSDSIAIAISVAPFMGAWIEICLIATFYLWFKVAPFMGAWIEIILRGLGIIHDIRRTLYGCVD